MTPVPTVAIRYGDYAEPERWSLTIVRRPLHGLWSLARREEWQVAARTRADAVQCVEYHFGQSALWYRLSEEARQ